MKWYRSDPERFAVEKMLLARHHPGVKIVIKDGEMSVFKKLATPRNNYLIKAKFSDRHPYSPMEVYIVEPCLRNTPPHQYSEGRLCLHGNSNVGSETTAKVYLDWAEQWIHIYERWLKTHRWPQTNRKSRSKK